MPASRSRLAVVAAALALAGAPPGAWDAGAMHTAAQKIGPPALAALAPLQSMLGSLQGLSETEKVAIVNRYMNDHIVFAEDIEVWGEDDRWASPLEALAKGRGDCEDYAIAKYASLLAAGVAPGRLRLVYVRARVPVAGGAGTVARAHMVLAYQAAPSDDPLILDNLRPAVLPASARPDLTPVFSFNAEGLWHGTGPDSAGNPLSRLSRWREVWNKVRLEGFL